MSNYSNVLKYYMDREFNPVPIELKTKSQWDAHLAKRVNLLQNHLSIPVNLLRGKDVLEVGCNSGENALVLAHYGANLTLAEPNNQVYPRLHNNFKSFGLENQINKIIDKGLDDLELDKKYDLVVAEGFLNTMKNKDHLLVKLIKLCKDDGFLIINYDDRFGGYPELLKSCILKKICHLKKIDYRGPESFKYSKILFEKSFNKLQTSRPFHAWWEDQLVNPYASCIWSLQEILEIAEKHNFFNFSNSPAFSHHNMYKWYKNICDIRESKELLLNNWRSAFTYFITGKNTAWHNLVSVTEDEVQEFYEITLAMAEFLANDECHSFKFSYPESIIKILAKQNTTYHSSLSKEIDQLYISLQNDSANNIIKNYKDSAILNDTWGTLLHYVCLKKELIE